MKSIIMWTDASKSAADSVLHYNDNMSAGDLCLALWLMLENACEMDGYKLTCDLYEITEEIGS